MRKRKRSLFMRRKLDTNAVHLCFINCWRPEEGAKDPDFPGQKLSMLAYMPIPVDEACLCGSGKPFSKCCQRKPFWHPICRNPEIPGENQYSQIKMQSAIFTQVNGRLIHKRLVNDLRLHCTEDTFHRAFWLYWGEPAIKLHEGVLCFGDIELFRNETLQVAAMSDLRMRVILDFLREVCGDLLGEPEMVYDPIMLVDKRTGELIET